MGLRTKDPELVQGAPLSSSALEGLRRAFRGQLLAPSDDGYDASRQVRNAMVDRYPALIARCLGAADVASTRSGHGSAVAADALRPDLGYEVVESGSPRATHRPPTAISLRWVRERGLSSLRWVKTLTRSSPRHVTVFLQARTPHDRPTLPHPGGNQIRSVPTVS